MFQIEKKLILLPYYYALNIVYWIVEIVELLVQSYINPALAEHAIMLIAL
jgi:hypothetical protein